VEKDLEQRGREKELREQQQRPPTPMPAKSYGGEYTPPWLAGCVLS